MASRGRPALTALGDVVTVEGADGRPVTVGPCRSDHVDALYSCFADVVARGDGFPHAAPLTRAVFADTWVTPTTAVVVAEIEGRFAGAYYLKPNQPGLGAHIANAGYVVERARRGQGVGRVLVADSIDRAPLAGFDAVQFNWVFSSNPARRLYEQYGWREIGRVPDAVPRADGTREDAVIYWRSVGSD
jgi:GNAT superfamily N-acetyltransferase